MDKTAQNEWHRLYLIDCLPEPLTAASAHLQIFDNYVEGTRIRLRAIRDPSAKSWTSCLQQRFDSDEVSGLTKMSEIHLNEDEYGVFERFEGREIRKNRYFHEFDRRVFVFDIYLGPLWGLNTAKVEFDDRETMDQFVKPPFAVFEVTGDPFFSGQSLVTRSFADVQSELAKVASGQIVIPEE